VKYLSRYTSKGKDIVQTLMKVNDKKNKFIFL